MTQDENLTGPASKSGLSICIVFFLLSGWFVCNEYFIIGAEVAKTTLIVFAFLISSIAGLALTIGLMTPLSTIQRSNIRVALGIVLAFNLIALLLYILLRVG